MKSRYKYCITYQNESGEISSLFTTVDLTTDEGVEDLLERLKEKEGKVAITGIFKL